MDDREKYGLRENEYEEIVCLLGEVFSETIEEARLLAGQRENTTWRNMLEKIATGNGTTAQIAYEIGLKKLLDELQRLNNQPMTVAQRRYIPLLGIAYELRKMTTLEQWTYPESHWKEQRALFGERLESFIEAMDQPPRYLTAYLEKEKSKLGNQVQTAKYRWDSVLTIRELVELLAHGDKVLEKQMRDTLRRLPERDYMTMNGNHDICRVVLSTGLFFLESEGYKLPEWAASFKDNKGTEKSTPPPVNEVKAPKQKKPKAPRPFIVYWSEMQKKNPEASAIGILDAIKTLLKGNESEEKREAQKHFEMFDNGVSLKGTKRTYAKSTIDGWHSEANKLWR